MSERHESRQPTLLYLIKQIERAVRARLEEALQPERLTVVQYTALTVLERRPNLTTAQLARNSFVTAQSMADVVLVLTARSLIERHRDPSDNRRLDLSLTTEGRLVLWRLRDKVQAVEELMLTGLTERNILELRQHLVSCRAALSEQPSDH